MPLHQFKKVAFAALFTALKYEAGGLEPRCKEVANASGGVVSPDDILGSQWTLLQALIEEGGGKGWRLQVPTVYTFVHLFLRAAQLQNEEDIVLRALEYAERSLSSYALLRHPASMTAAAIIHLALKATPNVADGDAFPNPLIHASGYSAEDLRLCEEALLELGS